MYFTGITVRRELLLSRLSGNTIAVLHCSKELLLLFVSVTRAFVGLNIVFTVVLNGSRGLGLTGGQSLD